MTVTLEDALQNALLFAGDSKSASQGLIKVSSDFQTMQVFVEAYDDFTYVRTTVNEVETETQWYKDPRDIFLEAKAVRAALREGLGAVEALETHPDPGCFGDAAELISQPAALLDGFYFSVDRWKKLGSLKPAGLPMEFRTHSDGGFPYGSFKYGSSVGLVSFLDRDVLEEEGLL